MSKLIYAKSKAGFELAYTDRGTTSPIYRSIVFTEDGYLWTHGQYFRILVDGTNLFTSTTTDGIATLKDSNSTTVASIDVGVTGLSGDSVIKVGNLTNGVIALSHELRSAGADSDAVNTVGSTYSAIKIPSLTVNKYGHVTSLTSVSTPVDRVAASVATGTFYLLGHTASTAGTATASKISSIYGDSAGNLSASKFLGKLNNSLTITYNGTALEYDNTQALSLTMYGPTTSGTSGQLAYSTGSGVGWKDPSTTITSSSTHNQIPTAAAVWDVIGAGLSAADAMVYKGTIGVGGTITALPTSGLYSAGWTYRVITAGTYAGQKAEIGDMIIAVVDRADGVSGTNSDWTIVQANIDGAVIGPASSVDGRIAVFDGISGKVIKDSGISPTTAGINFMQIGNPTTTNSFIRVTSAGVPSYRTPSNVKSDIGLGNVENTKLSTWAGSSNLTTLGTITTGTWTATDIGLAHGGTGASLTAVAGGVVYSTASGMAISSAGSTNQVLLSGGTGSPTWANQASLSVGSAASAGTATNLAGGAQGSIPYQTAAGSTTFLSAPTTNGFVLKYNTTNKAPYWAADIDTHYTTMLYVGASSAKSNAAATNPYLKLFDDDNRRSQFRIKGAGATTVKSDANGNITIQSANDNTWRNITAYTLANPTTATEVLSNSIGTADLQFGSEFIWDSEGDGTTGPELKIGWAEISTTGTVTYGF